MEATVSVSKGVFLFPNGYSKQKSFKKKSKGLFEKLFAKEVWYTTYKRNWASLENQIKDLHLKTYSTLLNDIVDYLKSAHEDNELIAMNGIIPSATLLTGVNQPDHMSQFETLIEMIRYDVTPHIALVNSQDAPTLKHLVENSVWQLLYGNENELDDSDTEIMPTHKLRKRQCSMKALKDWYINTYIDCSPKKRRPISSRSLVIIIPDFESFNSSVLQDFVMIISSYIHTLPIVLIFGVATSVSALHKSFPYHVSSKLLIKVFHSHASHVYMNQVLEDIFLTHESPLHLSGKALTLLTDVFLFYDFSVTGLIHSIKYCMMEHYYGDNTKALSCDRDKLEEVLMNLNSEELESIRQLMSFRPYLEAQDAHTKIRLFEDDNFFRKALYEEIIKLHGHLHSFYASIRILAVFVKILPTNALGKSIRELYAKCCTENITETAAFGECMQLIKFQSQVRLVETVKNALKELNAALKIVSPIKPLRSTPTKNNLNNIHLNKETGQNFLKTVKVHLMMFLRQIENSNTEATILSNVGTTGNDDNMENVSGNRYKLMEKLQQATRADRIQSEFEMIRSRFVSYLEEMFSKGLSPPMKEAFHELFFFNDVTSVKKQIVGSPRGALHTALSNPVHYLHCPCCELPSTSVSATLPGVSLAYKLHRECGNHINLYDWLQAFAAVLNPSEDDEAPHQDPVIQARFTRAVAELQFLGFIKSSKRKTDHVMRLTW